MSDITVFSAKFSAKKTIIMAPNRPAATQALGFVSGVMVSLL